MCFSPSEVCSMGSFCVRWLNWLANSTHLRAAKVTQLCVSNLISDTFLIYWRKYNFCFLFCVYQNSWKSWIFTSPLCGQGNIHPYSPPFQWITVKYRSNACQIEIVKYVQPIGIELSLLISIWLSLRNLQIPGFTTIVALRHILWSPIRPLPGKTILLEGRGRG